MGFYPQVISGEREHALEKTPQISGKVQLCIGGDAGVWSEDFSSATRNDTGNDTGNATGFPWGGGDRL